MALVDLVTRHKKIGRCSIAFFPFRKHVKDFSMSRETNDLGIVNVDLKADILLIFLICY